MFNNNSAACIAATDIAAAVKRRSLVGMLGWQDVHQRYRRSKLGPFWLTISMGFMIGTIGVVFGRLFGRPLSEFLPFLAIGLILWGYISAVINEGCNSFIAAESIIKQLPIPLFVHVLRMVWRNIIIFGHNLVIFPLVLVAMGRPITWAILISPVGFLLLTLNLIWFATILGVLCTRYRDLPQMVSSILLVVFYLTPVIWMPDQISGKTALYIVDSNPLYHLLEIVRAPLLGQMPSLLNWAVTLALLFLGWGFAILFYGRYKRRLAYWL